MTSNDTIRSIVLIDDDADFLHIMQRRLQAKRLDYAPSNPVEIRAYTDVVEALVNLPAEGICVIFIDYNMPGSTGLDSLPKLLKAGIGPVILLTNQDDVKITAEAFRAGATDYIAKSEVVSDDNRLTRAIREAVHRYRLEERNTVLTRQLKLINVELESKNKRLRELTDTAHQFVEDVAHDFRTPLTVIQQYASIISDGLSGPVTSRQNEQLEMIVESTRDLSEMVDDFLDSSKLRARTLLVDRREHVVKELFDSVEPLVTARGQSKEMSIQWEGADHERTFFGDLSMANRILTNLTMNAIKVVPHKGSMRISAQSTKEGDVRISVTDNGPGIKPDNLKIIFDRFQQGGEKPSDNAGGFGLGLSIVKQLTWLNLGQIHVQSEIGKGSTFSFTLPGFDPQRIIACYLKTIQSIDEAGDLWVLRIRAREGDAEVSALRHLIASLCYARDLVLADTEEQTVNVIGICSDINKWMDRLRESAARSDRSSSITGPKELEIKPQGPWARDGESAALIQTLTENLTSRSTQHV